jgi:polyhydroxyalkanoate synthase
MGGDSAQRHTVGEDAQQSGDFGGEVLPGLDLRAVVTSLARSVGFSPRGPRAWLGFGFDLLKVAAGTSKLSPSEKDRRFADAAWKDNPGYHRLAQAYLAWCKAVEEAASVDELDDWRKVERVKWATEVIKATMAPTNTLVGNPRALKRAFDTGGRSLVRGARNMLADVWNNNGMPRMVDWSQFKVGKDLACSPGAVIMRDPLFELVQYDVPTKQTWRRPLVIVPPQINKYYFCDLSPGRSFVQYLAQQGVQVFMISWKNPGPAQRHWDLATYVHAMNRATAAAAQITEADGFNVMGLCAGGQTAATTLAWREAEGLPPASSLTFVVTLLDFSERTMIGMFNDPAMLKFATALARLRGVVKGKEMKSLFAWFRPDELVFPYVVNNYLLGQAPPAFDILAWNDDSTNLPAALHRDFLALFTKNNLARPATLTVAEHPIDLGRIKCDTYVVGGETDHLTPWRADYHTVNLVGGTSTFVFANTGHIQTIVCPPGQSKTRYRTGPEPSGRSPDEWLAASTEHEGTWWEHYVDWLIAHSGEKRPSPSSLGAEQYPVLEQAPGRYIYEPA